MGRDSDNPAVQRVVDELYQDVDRANSKLDDLGAGWRFVRLLDARQVEPEREAEPPAPTQTPALSGDVCPDCHSPDLVWAGPCKRCNNCGSTTGGCS